MEIAISKYLWHYVILYYVIISFHKCCATASFIKNDFEKSTLQNRSKSIYINPTLQGIVSHAGSTTTSSKGHGRNLVEVKQPIENKSIFRQLSETSTTSFKICCNQQENSMKRLQVPLQVPQNKKYLERRNQLDNRDLKSDKNNNNDDDDLSRYPMGDVSLDSKNNNNNDDLSRYPKGDIEQKDKDDDTFIAVTVPLLPFTIELNQGVWESELHLTLIQYLTDTMMLRHSANETIQLFTRSSTTTSVTDWNHRFYYEGNVTVVSENPKTKGDGSRFLTETVNPPLSLLVVDQRRITSRIVGDTESTYDPSIVLMKEELALQDYDALADALRSNAFKLTTNLSSTVSDTNELLEVIRVDVITDKTSIDAWNQGTQATINTAKPDDDHDGKLTDANDVSVENDGESSNTTDIRDWLSSIAQDFDASSTHSQLMLGAVAIAMLTIVVVIGWIIIRRRSSSQRKARRLENVDITSSDLDLVYKNTKTVDEDDENDNVVVHIDDDGNWNDEDGFKSNALHEGLQHGSNITSILASPISLVSNHGKGSSTSPYSLPSSLQPEISPIRKLSFQNHDNNNNNNSVDLQTGSHFIRNDVDQVSTGASGSTNYRTESHNWDEFSFNNSSIVSIN